MFLLSDMIKIATYVADNQITAISGLDPTILTRLHTLEFRGNQLESTDGINLPNLKNLFLVSM